MSESKAAVQTESVRNSMTGTRELVDSTLDDITRLRIELDSVLRPQESQDVQETGHPPFSVEIINDVEQTNEIIREIRYVIREVIDRLAL